MSFNQLGENNTYEWKIEYFSGDDYHYSPFFEIDGCQFGVYAYYEAYSKSEGCLWKIVLNTYSVSYDPPVSYSISVIDSEGKDFVTAKGRVELEGEWQKRVLMMLDSTYLEEYKLTEGDVLTVRFTLGSKLDNYKEEVLLEKEEQASMLQTLSNDLGCFFESKTDADCVLSAGDTLFPVHRAVLSARSPVFSEMFHQDSDGYRTWKVDIPNVDGTAFGYVLHYVYTGKIRGLTAATATCMYIVADKYVLVELRKVCLDFLKRSLTTENICDAALLAYTHAEFDLEKRVVRFMEERLEEILQSDTWQEFIKTRTSFASQLLTSVCMAAKAKQV